jgi:hypothetical protein
VTAQVRATTSFSVAVGEVEHFVHGGEVLASTHPAAKARPELFEPAPDRPSAAKRRATRKTK